MDTPSIISGGTFIDSQGVRRIDGVVAAADLAVQRATRAHQELLGRVLGGLQQQRCRCDPRGCALAFVSGRPPPRVYSTPRYSAL